MNMINNMGLDHRAWFVGSEMDWRVRLGRLDWSDGLDGDRAVWADRRFRAGGRNGSATIGS